MCRGALRVSMVVLLASTFGGAAQDKAEAVDPNNIREAPKKFEGKTVLIKEMGMPPGGDSLTALDKKGTLFGLTLVRGSNDYYFGKVLNKEGFTFVASKELAGQLQNFRDKKAAAKLVEMNVTCKVEKRDAYWVAVVTQVEIIAVGARNIKSVIIK